MSSPNDFQARFCQQYAIRPENYAQEVLRRTTYIHAWFPIKVLGLFSSYYLQADYDFIHDVGRLTRFREYEAAVRAFFDHPMNRNNPLRNVFLLRVSTVRMRRLVREVIQKANSPVGTESTNPHGIQSPKNEARPVELTK